MSKMNYPDLAGKIAVVTGAGGGIGRAMAAAFRQQGATVVATDLDLEALSGVDADCRQLDVTQAQAVRELADAVAARYGALDVWVNNAGFMARMPALDLDEAAWQRTMDINLKGTFFGAQAAARHMIAQGSGAIINLSSYAGVKPRPNCADYAAAKAGVAGMSRALARELGSRNITVNCVAPGFIETDMTSVLPEDQQKALNAQIPLGHMGKPADIAHAVAYLASREAGYVTGQELHVNGGMYM